MPGAGPRVCTGLCSCPHHASEDPASGLPHCGGVLTMARGHRPPRSQLAGGPGASSGSVTFLTCDVMLGTGLPLRGVIAVRSLSLFPNSLLCLHFMRRWSWRRVPWAHKSPHTPAFLSPTAVSAPACFPASAEGTVLVLGQPRAEVAGVGVRITARSGTCPPVLSEHVSLSPKSLFCFPGAL